MMHGLEALRIGSSSNHLGPAVWYAWVAASLLSFQRFLHRHGKGPPYSRSRRSRLGGLFQAAGLAEEAAWSDGAGAGDGSLLSLGSSFTVL
jgi:hypothetical protein